MGLLARLAKGVATWAGVGLVTLLVMECTLRVYNPVDLPLRGTNIVLPANKHLIFDNPVENSKIDARIEVTYNSIGFRGPDPPPDFEERFSIVTVGGSTTHSARQGNGLDWSSHLRSALDEAFDNVWLNNAGLEGHSTFGHMFLIEQFLSDLRPDMAIFLIGINDRAREEERVYDFHHRPEDQALGRKLVNGSELLSTGLVLWRQNRAQRQGLRHWELELSELARVDTSLEDVEGTLAEHRSRFAPAYRSRVLELIRLSRQFEIEPVFLTQPALMAVGADVHTGIDIGGTEAGDHSAGLSWLILDVYNDVLREIAEPEGVLVIDLASDLPKDSRLFYDWVHFTNLGAEAVGGVIAPPLIAHLRASPEVTARTAP